MVDYRHIGNPAKVVRSAWQLTSLGYPTCAAGPEGPGEARACIFCYVK